MSDTQTPAHNRPGSPFIQIDRKNPLSIIEAEVFLQSAQDEWETSRMYVAPGQHPHKWQVAQDLFSLLLDNGVVNLWDFSNDTAEKYGAFDHVEFQSACEFAITNLGLEVQTVPA